MKTNIKLQLNRIKITGVDNTGGQSHSS